MNHNTAPLCGTCTNDLTEWAEHAAARDDLDPAEMIPCPKCGNP